MRGYSIMHVACVASTIHVARVSDVTRMTKKYGISLQFS